MTSPRVPAGAITVPRERQDEAAEVLALAFEQDPLMGYVFADQGEACHQALRELFRFSCAVRFDLDWPLFGIEEDGRLLGVAGVTAPEDKPWPPSLAATYEQYTSFVGPRAAARFERYAALADAHRPREPNYGLGVIGVRPDAQGRGHGRRLLDAVHTLSAVHPTSTGVYLDTTNPASKAFYEHCGYHVIGQETLDGVAIWCMFRPDDGA